MALYEGLTLEVWKRMRHTVPPPASRKRSTTAAPGNGRHVAFHAGERETVVGTPAGKVRAAAGACTAQKYSENA